LALAVVFIDVVPELPDHSDGNDHE
jgi:hypothetical protein